MIPDMVQQIIDEDREGFYESCNNCEIKSSVSFDGNGGKICCGNVKYPSKDVPFDIIRLCIIAPDHYSQHNLAPDEALEISTSLTDTVNRWMYKTQSYKNFRCQT